MRLLALFALTATLGTGTARAAVVDFQDLTSGSCEYLGTTAVSRGFTFTGNPSGTGLFACDPGVLQRNDSAALIDANERSIVTMSPLDGGTFSLDSFYAGGRAGDFDPQAPVDEWYGVATAIEVLGHLGTGGTVSATFALGTSIPYAWDRFVLPDAFAGLTSVVFTALGAPAPEFLIDDITVNTRKAPANVPEPATLALALAAALAYRVRRAGG